MGTTIGTLAASSVAGGDGSPSRPSKEVGVVGVTPTSTRGTRIFPGSRFLRRES